MSGDVSRFRSQAVAVGLHLSEFDIRRGILILFRFCCTSASMFFACRSTAQKVRNENVFSKYNLCRATADNDHDDYGPWRRIWSGQVLRTIHRTIDAASRASPAQADGSRDAVPSDFLFGNRDLRLHTSSRPSFAFHCWLSAYEARLPDIHPAERVRIPRSKRITVCSRPSTGPRFEVGKVGISLLFLFSFRL